MHRVQMRQTSPTGTDSWISWDPWASRNPIFKITKTLSETFWHKKTSRGSPMAQHPLQLRPRCATSLRLCRQRLGVRRVRCLRLRRRSLSAPRPRTRVPQPDLVCRALHRHRQPGPVQQEAAPRRLCRHRRVPGLLVHRHLCRRGEQPAGRLRRFRPRRHPGVVSHRRLRRIRLRAAEERHLHRLRRRLQGLGVRHRRRRRRRLPWEGVCRLPRHLPHPLHPQLRPCHPHRPHLPDRAARRWQVCHRLKKDAAPCWQASRVRASRT